MKQHYMRILFGEPEHQEIIGGSEHGGLEHQETFDFAIYIDYN